MARIRSVKPEFFKHGELQDLENANKGQFIMLVYVGLWTQCDKQGVFFYEARALHNEILPYINFDIQKTLNILEEGGFFRKFSSGNRKYGYVPNFSKYQFPTKGERQSAAKYPSPPDNITNVPKNVLENVPKAEGVRKKEEGVRKKDISGFNKPPLSESQKQVLELSELLLTSHRKEFPDYLSGKDTKKITEKWAEDIERLICIDKKNPEIIRQVILWVKTPNNFWFHNIESGKKLREKFEQLYGKMVTEQKKQTSPSRHKIAADNMQSQEVGKYFTEAT